MSGSTGKIIGQSLGQVGSTPASLILVIAVVEVLLYLILAKALKVRYTLPYMLIAPAAIGLALLVHRPMKLRGLYQALIIASAFSCWKFPGRNAGMVFLLSTQMIPAAMMMVPIYIIAAKLQLITIPVGGLFFHSSKWLVSGLTLGSVKV